VHYLPQVKKEIMKKSENFVLKMQQALKIIPNELLLIQAVATDPQHINFLFETDHK
jgi:hypothetical protein